MTMPPPYPPVPAGSDAQGLASLSASAGPPWALVTGASRGIGAAVARELATRGWALVLTARSGEALEALATELRDAHGVPVEVVVADLAEAGAPARLEAFTEGSGRPVDLLVNNAGVGQATLFVDEDPATMEATLAVNVLATTALLHRFASHMVRRGRGRILNVVSVGAFQPGPLVAVYYASKAYLLSLSEAIGNELAPHGITVTTLCPGPTRTDFHRRAGFRGSAAPPGVTLAEARDVARAGVEGALAGKGVVVPGFANRLLVLATRFLPRRLLLRATRRVQERRL